MPRPTFEEPPESADLSSPLTVALVVARAGSKSLPGKNVVPVHGVPSVMYAIEAALRCKSIDEVWISTDCKTCMSLARERGLGIIHRPIAYAKDNSSIQLAWLHALGLLKKIGRKVQTMVSLQADSPIREVDLLQRAISAHRNNEDGLPALSVLIDRVHVPAWTMTMMGDGTIAAAECYKSSPDHNSFPPGIWPTGGVIVFDAKIAGKSMADGQGLSDYYVPIEVPIAVDIHSKHDVELAEAVLDKWPNKFITIKHGENND